MESMGQFNLQTNTTHLFSQIYKDFALVEINADKAWLLMHYQYVRLGNYIHLL